MMWRLPVRIRLTAWYLGVTLLTSAAAFFAIYFGMRHAIERTIDNQLAQRTDEVHRFLWRHHELRRRHSMDTWADAFSRSSGVEPGQELYRLKGASGEWLYQSPAMQQLGIPASEPDLTSGPRYTTISHRYNSIRVLTTSTEVADKNYLLQVATIVTPFYAVLGIFRTAAMCSLIALVLGGGAGGYWLSGRAMRPVHEISAAARNISEHNLRERLRVPNSQDELSDLVRVLNSMLGRLDAAFRRINQFTADASHELRTPITLIRTTTEVMLERRRDVAEYEELGRIILQESELTSRLIEDLLTLARTDAGSSEIALSCLQASELARDAVNAMRPLAEKKGLKLLAEIADTNCEVLADAPSWKRLLLILLDNACKYTPAGGEVTLSLSASRTSAIFEVRDTGIGIPEQDRKAVFERFYRASNTRGLDVVGSGLGLSLAQWIAAAHKAKLDLQSKTNVGTIVRLSLPVCRTE